MGRSNLLVNPLGICYRLPLDMEQPVQPARASRAFTRMELLVSLAALGLIGLTILPLLANTSARGDRVACVNNLRLIGRAFLTWSADHNEKNPWELTQVEGGTRDHVFRGNCWFQFFFLSNHLASPQFLVCPADGAPAPPRRTALYWDDRPGGLLNPSFRPNAVSYILGKYATPIEPQSILSGDPNLNGQQRGDDVFGSAYQVGAPRDPPAVWTPRVHLDSGNLLFNDGRAEQTDTRGLRQALRWNNYYNSVFLFPYPPVPYAY